MVELDRVIWYAETNSHRDVLVQEVEDGVLGLLGQREREVGRAADRVGLIQDNVAPFVESPHADRDAKGQQQSEQTESGASRGTELTLTRAAPPEVDTDPRRH
jgi:hypothetical protein